MRALLLAALLLAPVAAAASAFPDGATLGAVEASVPLRVEGRLHVEASGAEVTAAPPGVAPASWRPAPADLDAAPGPWHGMENVTVLWVRRSLAAPVTIEVDDATHEGLLLEWPAPGERHVPATGAAIALVGIALVAIARRWRP